MYSSLPNDTHILFANVVWFCGLFRNLIMEKRNVLQTLHDIYMSHEILFHENFRSHFGYILQHIRALTKCRLKPATINKP